MGQQTFDLARQLLGISQVHEADGAAAHLVLISGTDATAGGANFGAFAGILAQPVQIAVQRQDQRGIVGDAQIVPVDGDALSRELFDLAGQRIGIKHHAIANDGELAGADDAGRQKRELVGHAINHKGVASIVAALKAHHHIGLLGQPVHQLALALIAPLGTDHNNIGHRISPMRKIKKPRHDAPGLVRPALKAKQRGEQGSEPGHTDLAVSRDGAGKGVVKSAALPVDEVLDEARHTRVRIDGDIVAPTLLPCESDVRISPGNVSAVTVPHALDQVLLRLGSALDGLDAAIARRAARDAGQLNRDSELALMQEDRARLADELDDALTRLSRLDAAAAETAERLDRAMASVRTVLDALPEGQ